MEKSKVAIVKGERGHEPVYKALDLIDYKSVLSSWQRVLIKVNFITTETWETGATTDPIVVEAIIKKLKDLPVEIFVVESDATMTNADKAFEATGMKEMCQRNGVECLNLRHIKDRVKIHVPNGETLRSITVPRIVTESAIISAAKLKTHSSTKVTLGMKNMFGLLPDKFKGKYHARGISKVIVDINTVLKPALTVIDGFVGMEGNGPIDGTPIKTDLIIAGKDAVATDATAARIMGFEPMEIFHIRKAYEKGLGNIDNIEILSSKLDEVRHAFKRA
ncbi:DUF362 domain-containing protein [Candidatus Bathyarchaeota archaeon A05DMB-2]|nr:DUF362 domain-containing protein [Candidatus Bathyarchaeota archaeon A05DMB-2]